MTEVKMSAYDIIEGYGKLVGEPGYYSGTRNEPAILNSDTIERVYNGVKTEIGAEAAKAFVNMVGEMAVDASPTTFIVSFYRLARNDWQFNSRIVPTFNGAFDESLKGEDSMTAGLGFLALALENGIRPNHNKRSGLFGWFKRRGSQSQPDVGSYIIKPRSASEITGDFLARHQGELAKGIPQPA